MVLERLFLVAKSAVAQHTPRAVAAAGVLFTVSSFAMGTVVAPHHRRSCFAGLCVVSGAAVVIARCLQIERAVMNLRASIPSSTVGTLVEAEPKSLEFVLLSERALRTRETWALRVLLQLDGVANLVIALGAIVLVYRRMPEYVCTALAGVSGVAIVVLQANRLYSRGICVTGAPKATPGSSDIHVCVTPSQDQDASGSSSVPAETLLGSAATPTQLHPNLFRWLPTCALAVLAASTTVGSFSRSETDDFGTAVVRTGVSWRLFLGVCKRMIYQRPGAAVHLTDSVVDVTSLERQAGAHVIRVSCISTTWWHELEAALQQATGERSGDAAIAHIRTMRSPNHWSSLFIAGIAPRADVFLACVSRVLCRICAVLVSIDFTLGRIGSMTRWLAKRPWFADWVRRGARSVDAHLEHGIAQLLLPDVVNATACGFAAALQGLCLWALLFDVVSRLRGIPSACEAAEWCACTNRPACVVLFIEFEAMSGERHDAQQLRLCVRFLREHVRLTTIIRRVEPSGDDY
jgi:hypothetical protein